MSDPVPMNSASLAEQVLAHGDLFDRLAERRFGPGVLAEEAALYVLNALEEDDWRRVRAYAGRSSFKAYLASLASRLLEDFARRRFGRKRPPAWIKALGQPWVRLYQLLCLERLEQDAALARLDPLADADSETVREYRHMAEVIRERVTDCGARQGLEDEYDDSRGSGGSDPEGGLMEAERATFLSALFAGLVEGKSLLHLGRVMERLRITLSPEERLLLKLCFQDNLPVRAAGEMLGLNANQAHGRLRRLLARIRKELDRAGIGDELRLLLQD